MTADEAFDAYATQSDPVSGERMRVLIVDVRSRAEFHWVGTPASVDRILLTDGEEIVPDYGKVRMLAGYVLYLHAQGRPMLLSTSEVQTMKSTATALSVPYYFWVEDLRLSLLS